MSKMVPNVVLFHKMAPKVCTKTHEGSFFWRANQKSHSWSVWEKICRQRSHKNVSGKFGEIRAKIHHTPTNFPAPTPMSYH